MEEFVPEGGKGLRRRMLMTDPAYVATFGDPFRPLEPECKVLQFSQPLTAVQLRRAGEMVASRPDVQLYVYGRASRDLDFLENFPALTRLHVALYQLEDLGGFGAVEGQLRELTFGRTRKTFSLGFLGRAPQLERLFLVGHKKDLEVVSGLRDIAGLGLSGITLADLSLLLPLASLRELSIFMGATTDLRLLPRLTALEDLFLMRITGLSDLSALAGVTSLAKLRLDWMRNVTALPSFAALMRLTNVTLDTMRGLTDLSPLAAAPALTRLTVAGMPQLTAASFQALVGHPRLAELWAYTGKAKVNAAVKLMFPGVAH